MAWYDHICEICGKEPPSILSRYDGKLICWGCWTSRNFSDKHRQRKKRNKQNHKLMDGECFKW